MTLGQRRRQGMGVLQLLRIRDEGPVIVFKKLCVCVDELHWTFELRRKLKAEYRSFSLGLVPIIGQDLILR